jgi:hypothetical protein
MQSIMHHRDKELNAVYNEYKQLAKHKNREYTGKDVYKLGDELGR